MSSFQLVSWAPLVLVQLAGRFYEYRLVRPMQPPVHGNLQYG